MADEELTTDEEQPDQQARRPSRADKPLPTTRIALSKQFDILRAYGTLYAQSGRPVKTTEVAVLVNTHADTTRLVNTFFVDVGLLAKTDAGFVPSQDVVNYHRANEFNSQNPEHKLQRIIRDAWFGRTLLTRLSFRGSMEETDALSLLGDAVNATAEHRPQLLLLLSFLQTVGLITRDGTTIRAPRLQEEPDVEEQTQRKPDNPIEQTTPNHQLSTAMRSVKLPNANGTLTVSGDFNPFALFGEERELVLSIIDKMNDFEKKRPADAKSGTTIATSPHH